MFALAAPAAVWAAEPAPVLIQSGPGRFEIAALESQAAQTVAAQADEAWRMLAVPLGLPAAFSTPVFVRLVPAGDWREVATFHTIVEAGGVVSARVRWSEPPRAQDVRRALVEALLLRLAVAEHGANEKLAAPLWLEAACLGWWQTRAEAAQLDALKQESARLAPPSLANMLGWREGAAEPRRLGVGTVWLLSFLQVESRRTDEWPAFLRRLLGGEEAGPALAATFAGRFRNDAERELWWETGWHHLIGARALPTLEAAESRRALAEAMRFVFALDGRDTVEPLRAVLAHGREPAIDAELKRHAVALDRLLPVLHPFYRNAGLSLADALATREGGAGRRESLCAAVDRDWRDAVELETAATAALDALEKKSRD